MLKDIHIKTLLPVSLFLLIVLTYSTYLASNKYFQYNSLKELKSGIDLSRHLSRTIHEIQRERGLSSGFIASNGKKLKKELIVQRNNTIKAINNLKVFLQNDNFTNIRNIKYLEINYLLAIRINVDTFNINTLDAIKKYSEINDYLLKIITANSKISRIKNITKQIEAYNNFLFAKETLGIERALGAAILANNKFLKSQKLNFLKLITLEDIYFEKFINFSNKQTINFFKNTIKGDELNIINQIRNTIINSNISKLSKISPEYWFKNVTYRINKLQTIDNYLENNITLSITQEQNKIFNKLILSSIFNILTIISFILLMNIIFKIMKKDRQARLLFEKYVISSTTDLKGNITYTSEAFCKISGYKQNELIGKPHNVVRSPDTPREVFKTMWQSIQDGKPWNAEIKNRKKDGSFYWVFANIEPIFDDNKNIIGYSAVRIDITKNKLLEEKIQNERIKNIQKDKAMLQQSKLAQMGEMISMIAHQWRQPLTAISASTNDLLLKNLLENYDKDYYDLKLKKVGELSQHLSKTIDDFRDFYKEDKEKHITTAKEIIDGSLNIILSTIKAKHIKIEQSLNSTQTINTYVNELRQVILNLLKNAEDVLTEKNINNPYILINTYDKNNSVHIEVIDNAGGINEAIFDKIFDPYFTTKDKTDGTGLGLYMSKIIIEDHCNGKLYVRNDKDTTKSKPKGAIFTIVIPQG